MTLKEFYRMMDISFIEGHVVQEKANYDKVYRETLNELIRLAENTVEALNDGNLYEIGRKMRKLDKALEEYRRVAVARGGKNNTNIPKEDYEKHIEKIESAIRSFDFNREEILKRENNFGYFDEEEEDDEEVINTNNSAIEGEEVEEIGGNDVVQNNIDNNIINYNANNNEHHEEEELGDVQFKTAGKFGEILKKLENARTRYNSGEYKDIIKMVKFANEYDEWEGTENLSYERTTIAKLIAIKSRINKYINHKAVKGVNQNAYHKLAVVEELNKMVTTAIGKLNFQTFTYGNTEVKRENYQFTYKEELEATKFERIRGTQYYAPEMKSEAEVRNHMIDIGARYPQANTNEMLNVDHCMCRILLSALNHREVTRTQIENLEDMRDRMYANPTDKIVPEAPERTSGGMRV